jgi:hypothetical protein
LRQRAKEKAEREEADGLCNPESLDIFIAWYSMGGSQSPPSLTDLYSIPAWLRKDIVYIYSIIGDERDTAKKKRKTDKAKVKPPVWKG